jgi:formylglycine-generating enzyme
MKALVLSGSSIAVGITLISFSAMAKTSPSCDGGPGAGQDCQGDSCCARLKVPGGEFSYFSDGSRIGRKVTVKTFYLDKFETTVGRFMAWKKAGQPMPKLGTKIQRDLRGKQLIWSKTAAAQVQRGQKLKGWARYDTFGAKMYSSPKNNINFYTALAFCHWDGGRLPNEYEFKYASVGGAEGRLHPWGDAAPTLDHAVYNCGGHGGKSCSILDILAVGSKPKGAGRWGHMDLAGSLFEWTVANQGWRPDKNKGSSRGGGFCYIGGDDHRAILGLQASTTRYEDLGTVSHTVGVRCAYD